MASIVSMEYTSTLLIIVRLIKKPALLLSLEGAPNLLQIFTNGHRLRSTTRFPDLEVEELCLEIHFWWLISYFPKMLVAVNILHMIKVKLLTDQVRPALGSVGWLSVIWSSPSQTNF